MDLQKIITEILGKLNLDSGLLAKFKKNPADTVKSLVGGDEALDENQLKTVIEGITAKLGLDKAVKSGGFLAKLKKLFGGK